MLYNHQINQHKEVIISVCVATYNRKKLLEKLLYSISNQALSPEINLEIIVTDNSSESNAKTILDKFSDTENIHFKYLVQLKKNISLTRNLSVENASGDYICFIDDDETASELWIQNLYDAMIKYNADGVFGYTEPIFDNNIPLHFRRREFYFTPVGETGTEASFYFTTNAIVKSDIIKNEKVLFDPGYGLTGGEDVHLFERLVQKGAKFIVSREAISYEYIPFERGTKKYLFNRALRGGQAFVRRKIEMQDNFSLKILILIKVIISISIALLYFLFFPISKKLGINGIINLGASVGKFRGLIANYKNIH